MPPLLQLFSFQKIFLQKIAWAITGIFMYSIHIYKHQYIHILTEWVCVHMHAWVCVCCHWQEEYSCPLLDSTILGWLASSSSVHEFGRTCVCVKKRHKCLPEREKPVHLQQGVTQCEQCQGWFRSTGGLAVHWIHVKLFLLPFYGEHVTHKVRVTRTRCVCVCVYSWLYVCAVCPCVHITCSDSTTHTVKYLTNLSLNHCRHETTWLNPVASQWKDNK